VTALDTELLESGSRTPADVAAELSAFIARAERSLEVAIYDFQAAHGASAAVGQALEGAATRGAQVRVVFNEERRSHPEGPPPPRCSPEEIDGLEVPTRAVRGEGSLMHHKYVVRDGQSVWTGSMNWTDDAFGLEENVIVRLDSPEVAAAYRHDFEQLWTGGVVEKSGGAGPQVKLDGVLVQPFFSPRGPSLAHLAATRLGQARHRIRVLSPVITSGPILGTLAEFAGRAAFDFVGAYDMTQMEQVQAQWADVPANRWKIEAWKVIASRLSGKRSTPYSEESVHDYMHAKALVADGEILVGSYNFSRGGEENAENMLHIVDGGRAEAVAAFAEKIAERYASG
jgi:phosphatidylserine/phosphatidylglycerophosphate/cardiolipin synthase-like enzyme